MERIIGEARFCRIAMCDNGRPYIVPLCFGYRDRTVFFHCAREGRKLEVLRKNSAVCVEFEAGVEVVENSIACKWKLRYRCVIAYGSAGIVEGAENKRRAMDVIMRTYTPGAFTYSDEDLAGIVVCQVPLESMTCKISA
jgi:hypothetical protein